MGAFGEASKDVLHYFVQKVQESRVVAVGLRSYKVESEVENGLFVSQIDQFALIVLQRRFNAFCTKKFHGERFCRS